MLLCYSVCSCCRAAHFPVTTIIIIIIMDAADALIKKIFSSVDLQTKCADKLDELANELEGTKKNVNTAKVVGSSLSVGGAAAMTAAGVATLFTGGAALPIIAMTSGAVSWVGLLTDATSDAVTFYQAKNTSEEAVKVVENIARLHDEIKDNMDSLRDEAKKKQQPYCSSGEDYVIEVILRGMAERNGLTLEGSVSLQKILEDHVGQSQTKRITSFLLLAKETATLIVIIEKSLTKLLQKATASAARETVKTAGGKTLRKAVGRVSITADTEGGAVSCLDHSEVNVETDVVM